MLSIRPVINHNYRMNPSFGERPEEQTLDEELQKEYQEYAEERQKWIGRRSEMQELKDNKEAPVVKPMKKILQAGIIGSAAALGALGTGYSAKYIMERGQEIVKSKQITNLKKAFKKKVSTPIAEQFGKVKEFFEKQIANIKKSKTYTTNKAKFDEKKTKFKKTGFAQFFSKTAKKVSDNKVVQKVTGFVDGIFNGIAEGVVKIYNKLTGVNYKNTVSNTVGAAGGISTGAATMMDMKAENDKEKAEKGIEEEYVSYEEA